MDKVNWKQVGLYLGLVFGLSWLLDLAIALTVGYGRPEATLLLQAQMLLPACCAIALEMYVFKGSALHQVRAKRGKPRIFYLFFAAYTLAFVVLGVAASIVQTDSMTAIAMAITQALTVLGLLLLIVLRIASGKESFSQAWLSGGKWRQWLAWGLGVALFYVLQTLLNRLFGLGEAVDVVRWMTESLPAEAQTMSPGTFLIVSAVQSVVMGSFLGLLIGFGEEYGWRGYLQRELVKLGKVKGIALLGVIWGVWHAPAIWLGHNYAGYPVLGTGLMVAYSTGLAFVLGYVVLKTGSVLLASFLHALNNQVYAYLTTMVYKPADPAFSFGVGIYGILTLGVVVLFLLRDPIWRQDKERANTAVLEGSLSEA